MIASFRSTLSEIIDSNLLLKVVDASSPEYSNHLISIDNVLEYLNIIEKKFLIIFNKIDLITSQEKAALEIKYGQPMVSSLKSDGILELRKFMENFINSTSMNKKVVNI